MSSAQLPCLVDHISTPGVWPAVFLLLAISQSTIQSRSRVHIISRTGSPTLALPVPATRSEPPILAMPLEAELMILEF
ncbi:hypothetical protein BDR03DRAFT_961456 [Suillus americanus]|nr:hypothetical protein BDR03DRAFT_961456 [Suillus americanus]